MPKHFKRFKTDYEGVYYVEKKPTGQRRTAEKVFFIIYQKDGKQIEETVGQEQRDDMTAARAWKIRAKRMQGIEPSNKERRKALRALKEAESNKWTIKRLWDDYKANSDIKGLATDENRFLKHIEPLFGEREPNELTPFDIRRLVKRVQESKEGERGGSPKTIRNVLELLRRIVNYGIKMNYCEGLPFPIAMPRGADKTRTEDLTPDQLSRLLEAIEADHNVAAGNLMLMALFTGMRRGELFKLKWEDVDFERGFIHIRDPKGGPDQIIPLNDAAREVLESHERTESPYVFPGKQGGMRVDMKRPINRIKKRAGLPKDFRPLHGLRHVYATMLASSGKVDMYTLQKLMTHKSPQMTQRYAHLRDEALKRAADVATKLLDEAREGKDRRGKASPSR